MHDVKARMIIGGAITRDGVRRLAETLARDALWVCATDEDDDGGDDPGLDPHYDDADPAGYYEALITDLADQDDTLVLTVDDEYYTHDLNPPNSLRAFSDTQEVCDRLGLFYRLRTAGGVTRMGDRHDREVVTNAPSGTYRGHTSLCGSMVVVGVNARTLAAPERLLDSARRAWMAALWPIPPLDIVDADTEAEAP